VPTAVAGHFYIACATNSCHPFRSVPWSTRQKQMDHFCVGPLEISRVEETRTQFDAGMFYPELARDTPARYASWLAPYFDMDAHSFPCVYQSFVVHHHKTTILIDTCIGNDKERPDFLLAHRLNNPYLDRLRAANCRPEDVDIVLCTHFHVDHVGWNTRLDNGRWVPTFPNARYIFSREEYSRFAPEKSHQRTSSLSRHFRGQRAPGHSKWPGGVRLRRTSCS